MPAWIISTHGSSKTSHLAPDRSESCRHPSFFFTFAPRRLNVYIAPVSTLYQEEKRIMMKNAGYLQLNRRPVLDEDGIPRDILELYLYGTRLCIRVHELRNALRSGVSARVEKIQRNWMAYIGGNAGHAQISKSGKALNIELRNGERFTVALDSLHAVLCSRERYASVAALPSVMTGPDARNRLITDYCPVPVREGPAAGALPA
jgi:RNase P/RNase MRP subunit p29